MNARVPDRAFLMDWAAINGDQDGGLASGLAGGTGLCSDLGATQAAGGVRSVRRWGIDHQERLHPPLDRSVEGLTRTPCRVNGHTGGGSVWRVRIDPATQAEDAGRIVRVRESQRCIRKLRYNLAHRLCPFK